MNTLTNNFDSVKANNSLETYARAKLKRARAGGNYVCPNPACNSGGHNYEGSNTGFHIFHSIKGDRFKCFSCNITGDICDLIGICEGVMNKNEQLKIAAKYANVSLDYDYTGANAATITPTSNFTPVKKKLTTTIQGEQNFEQAQKEEETRLKQWQSELEKHQNAIEYLEKRGYTLKQAQALQIGYNPQKQMLVLPYRGSKYYHIDRAINPTSKIKHFKPKSDILGAQPLYNPLALENDVCIVVEGVFDALALESLGFENVIALGGCSNQTVFINTLKTRVQKPYTVIFFDNDNSGQKAASNLKTELNAIGAECKTITSETLKAENLQGKDPDEIRKHNSDALKSFLSRFLNECKQEHSEKEEERYKSVLSVFNIIDIEDELIQLCSRDYKRETIKTGLKCLDDVLGGGVPIGLTVIGALSSLGKTTLCLQIADFIAASKRPVLFVTIEQSTKELLTKSLSRISYSLQGDNLTGYDVLTRSRTQFSENNWHALYQAINAYNQTIKPYMQIMEGKTQPNVQDITNAARFIANNEKQAPVIFIDYLQLLAPINSNATDKQNTDNNVSALRQLARELKTSIVLISSLNRANYNSPIALESFKESGSIEYSSDVLLGLQPASFSELNMTNEKTQKKDAKDKIKTHKQQARRELELIVLKNRNGAVPKEGLKLSFNTLYSLWGELQNNDGIGF